MLGPLVAKTFAAQLGFCDRDEAFDAGRIRVAYVEEPLDEDPLEEELPDEEERLEAFLAEEEVRVFIVTLPTVPSCASLLRF